MCVKVCLASMCACMCVYACVCAERKTGSRPTAFVFLCEKASASARVSDGK